MTKLAFEILLLILKLQFVLLQHFREVFKPTPYFLCAKITIFKEKGHERTTPISRETIF